MSTTHSMSQCYTEKLTETLHCPSWLDRHTPGRTPKHQQTHHELLLPNSPRTTPTNHDVHLPAHNLKTRTNRYSFPMTTVWLHSVAPQCGSTVWLHSVAPQCGFSLSLFCNYSFSMTTKESKHKHSNPQTSNTHKPASSTGVTQNTARSPET